MIIFLKSSAADGWRELPLQEKLVPVFKDRVENAEDDEDRARAKQDLAKLTRHSRSEKKSDKESAVD